MLKSGGLYIGRVEKAPLTGEEVFTVSLKVAAPDGKPRVLMASLAPDVIEGFLQKVMVNQAAIARSDGRMLARLPKFPGGLTEAPRAALLLSQLEGGGPKDKGIVGFAPSADGVARRTAYKHVADYPLYVLGGVEKGTVVSQAITTMASHLIFGIPATLSLIALTFLALRSARAARREEKARHQVEAQLSEVRRLEALGQLTGGVAHDFNNLLMVIQGGLGLLSRRVTDERSRRQIGIMSAAVERGANLTGQLLAFGRRQPLHPGQSMSEAVSSKSARWREPQVRRVSRSK